MWIMVYNVALLNYKWPLIHQKDDICSIQSTFCMACVYYLFLLSVKSIYINKMFFYGDCKASFVLDIERNLLYND